MKKIMLYIVPVVIMLLASCEKRIEFDYEEVQPKVVVQSHNTVGDNVSITLTESRPIFGYHSSAESRSFRTIENAQAVLTVGGNSYAATQNGGVYSFGYQPQSGDVMTLSVNVPGHDAISASTTVPMSVNVGNVSLVRGVDETTILIPINDDGDDENYYGIRIREMYIYNTQGSQQIDTEYVWFECEDPLFVESDLGSIFMDEPGTLPCFGGREFLIDDGRINGLSHTLKLTVSRELKTWVSSTGDRREYELIITSYSRDEYMYRKAFVSGRVNDLDDILGFFAEPMQIHCNINGGCGLFGARVDRTFDIFD